MGLVVWLPLTGTTENKGLCNITATNTGATESAAGKIGSCYSYTTTQSSYLEITGLPFTELTNCSISFWIKVDSMSTNGWLMFTGQSTSYYVMATQNGTGTFHHGNAGSNLKIYKDGVLNSTPGATGEWQIDIQHLGILREKSMTLEFMTTSFPKKKYTALHKALYFITHLMMHITNQQQISSMGKLCPGAVSKHIQVHQNLVRHTQLLSEHWSVVIHSEQQE